MEMHIPLILIYLQLSWGDTRGQMLRKMENFTLPTTNSKLDSKDWSRTGDLPLIGKMLYFWATVDTVFEGKLLKCTSSFTRTIISIA